MTGVADRMMPWSYRNHILMPHRQVPYFVRHSICNVLVRFVMAVWLVAALGQNGAWAETLPAGDLAPLNNPDGALNAADAMILQRIIMGSLTPTQIQLRVGDVAPLGAPDGELNAGDLVVLMRAINGVITLPDVYVGPDAPLLDAPISPTNANPYVISGAAEPTTEIRIYINGTLANTGLSGADGSFAFSATLSDGVNLIYATATSGGLESTSSNVVPVDYQNNINRNQTNTVITQDTVWTPGITNQPYVIEGGLTVANGATLIILPGTVLSLGFGAALDIHGSVRIVGTPTQPITFTSDSPSPQVGDWYGIRIQADASNVTIRHAHISWADYGIYDLGATNVTIANNIIENTKYGGIYVSDGAASLIESNTILTSGYQSGSTFIKGNGIEIENASPTIRNNTISGHRDGLLVKYASNPSITDRNRVTGNDRGIDLWGDSSDAANNPNPVITGNSVYQNTQYNLITDGYADPINPDSFVELEYDFSGNWWGSTDPSAIAEKIYDFKNTRGSYAPVVKLVPFLDSENGAPVAGNYLNGLYSSSLTLSSATPYVVAGSFVIGSGAALTVLEGVRLEFARTTGLVALGSASVIGQPSSTVVFTSYAPTKTAGDWAGIALFGAGAIVSFAEVEYVTNGIVIQGANTSVSNTRVSSFLSNGISIEMPVSATIQNCQIVGQQRQGTGINVDSSEALIENNAIQNTNYGVNIRRSPTVRGNVIGNNNRGISLFRGSASSWADNPGIEFNRITSNAYGIYIDAYGSMTGDPNPAIHENEIHGNTTFNLYIRDYHPTVFVDATMNWWGTDDENALLAALNSPQIKYSPYKNSLGQAVYSERLAGVLSADTVIAPGEIRQVGTSIIVPQGNTLTLGAGSRLEFAPGAALVVNGNLLIEAEGVSNPILTSSVPQPQSNGYWGGLVINAAGVDIHDIDVRYATTGAAVYASNVILRDSVFSACWYKCVSFQGQSTSQILATAERLDINVSPSSSTAVGMEFIHANGRVSGSTVRNAYRGIASLGRSGVRIEKSTIESNSRGIYVTSNYGGTHYSPAKPVTQHNNIMNNTVRGYETTAYGISQATVLNATYNWWGTDQDAAIQAAIYDEGDATQAYPLVTYSPYLLSAVAMPPKLNPLPATSNADTLVVTGLAAPTAVVDIYVNDAIAGSAVADAAGDFSASVPLAQGVNTVYAVNISGSVASYPSRSYGVTYDNLAPVITLSAPADGLLTNQYAMTFSGTVSEPATLTIGGIAVVLDANNAFSYGPVYLAEGANAIELVATDQAGNVTTQTVHLTLDSTPPADPNMGLINFGPLSGGSVTVTGAPGAAEPSTYLYLTNARTGETVRVTVQPDGSFTASIAAGAGDDLGLVVSDALGNQAPWHSETVAGSPATLAIVSVEPANGTVITGDRVTVFGTWNGPSNTGITVNGQVAEVYGDRFLADGILLEPGANTLTVTATTVDGATVTHTQSLTRSGDNPLTLTAEPLTFSPPFMARVTLTLDVPMQSVAIDRDGDGGTDWSATNTTASQQSVDLTYPEAGLHVGVVHAIDEDGTHYDIPFGVVLEDAQGTQARRRSVYQQMLDRLGQSDISGALNVFMGTSRAHYEQIFNQLTSDLPSLVPGFVAIDQVELGRDWAQLRMLRDVSGQKQAYYITLVRGDDGVWRIEGM